VQHIAQHDIWRKEDLMKPTATVKGGRETVAPGEKLNLIESLNQLYTKNVKQFAEFQKRGADLAAGQNAELINTWKKYASGSPIAPDLLDLNSTSFDRVVEAQKTAIDLMVEQSEVWSGLVKDRVETVTKAVETGTKFARASVEHAVEMQKTAIDFSAKQTAAALDTAKKQFGDAGVPIGAAVDSMQRGVEAVVGAHKAMLDLSKKSTQVVH
jgi:methyl-accepting chemotaxis protein